MTVSLNLFKQNATSFAIGASHTAEMKRWLVVNTGHQLSDAQKIDIDRAVITALSAKRGLVPLASEHGNAKYSKLTFKANKADTPEAHRVVSSANMAVSRLRRLFDGPVADTGKKAHSAAFLSLQKALKGKDADRAKAAAREVKALMLLVKAG